LALLAGLFLLWPGRQAEVLPKENDESKAQLRRPVSMALADKFATLYVANRSAGTISTIDLANRRVVSERPVGKKLGELCLTSDEKHLLVVDEEDGQLIELQRTGTELKVAGRATVPTAPVSVKVSADGRYWIVASLWARKLTIFDSKQDKPLAASKMIDLPFAPRAQLAVANTDKMVVVDAFGGNLAVVDVVRGVVDSVRKIPGHQIRGLAWSSDGSQLLVTHQILRANVHSSHPDIHWGNLMANQLRSLARTDLLNPGADLLANSRLTGLGDPDHGTGDPAGVAVTADGIRIVALGGVTEVAIGNEKKGSWSYVEVGQHPTAVVTDGKRAFVANTFSDTITVIDLAQKAKVGEIVLGKQRPLSAAERGEVLFFDAGKSLEGWLSCNSCHVDGHTNGMLNDNLSDDTFGTPKRVLTVLGVKDTAPWAWNGGVKDLKEQIRKSLVLTMRGPKPKEEELLDLEAYLRTLPPPPPLQPETPANREPIQRGQQLFAKLGCANCHIPPLYTSPKTYDVGLADEQDNREYNPPSLRGVSQGGPYFHDNRAASLEAVFSVHRHQIKQELTKTELAELLVFLRSL
jgi:DNA-binding beta-propeller fold protein YncE